jgi:2,3,4,5-tetrahydropyridine-2-carboxylate N-succinyltransferase
VSRLTGETLLDALEQGELRVAERAADGRWTIHAWVKEELLALFRSSAVVAQGFEQRDVAADQPSAFRDKSAFPVRRFGDKDGVRIVPGGSAVRRGAYLAPGVVCMPPMYVNIGAWVGAGTLIDSHALVGSCAQIGAKVHLSAAAQIGGVLEPANARPVIVEDECFVGGNTGIYEGVLVRKGAVIAAGVVLTASTPVFDLVNRVELRGTRENPLEIPERAVLVPGSRPVGGEWGASKGLQAACALIVKYRDEKTDRATALESALREGLAGG